MKELMEFMSSAENVDQWNELRDEAKEKWSIKEIQALDHSGYIVEILNK